MRLIGDVHGKVDQYYKIANEVNHSIQVGDLSFNYEFLKYIKTTHIAILGNHDNFDDAYRWTNILPHGYGNYNHFGFEFFYVSGAYSIDWNARVYKEMIGEWPKTWWKEEELSYAKLEEAIHTYERIRPDFVITHEAPRSVVNNVTDGRVLRNWNLDPKTFTTKTSEALDAMFRIHQPKNWVFGHYHRHTEFTVNGTNFLCLAELDYKDF